MAIKHRFEKVVNYGADRSRCSTYALFANPCRLYRLDGYCTGANTFLQLFDRATTPTGGDIPVKVFPLFGNDGYSWAFSKASAPTFFQGMFLALSSDERNYVADSVNKVSGDVSLTEGYVEFFP